MRQISKSPPPTNVARAGTPQRSILQAHYDLKAVLATLTAPAQQRAEARNAFNAVDKPTVRNLLFTEQHGLCVFCESQTHDADPVTDPFGVRIAHWTPIKHNPWRALTWTNLYTSCAAKGRCDDGQGHENPVIAAPNTRDWGRLLVFHDNGTVTGQTGAPPALVRMVGLATGQKKKYWHLGHPTLVTARAAAIDALRQMIVEERDRTKVAEGDLRGGMAH